MQKGYVMHTMLYIWETEKQSVKTDGFRHRAAKIRHQKNQFLKKRKKVFTKCLFHTDKINQAEIDDLI